MPSCVSHIPLTVFDGQQPRTKNHIRLFQENATSVIVSFCDEDGNGNWGNEDAFLRIMRNDSGGVDVIKLCSVAGSKTVVKG
jgi:hypothetical protein